MSVTTLAYAHNNSYYITGIFSAGVYIYDNNALLIDSGSDETSAKAIHNAIESGGYTVSAIINTHCHPDHCGGNYFFQKKLPHIRIYATYDEKFFIEDPKWAPRCFCGNAEPIASLRNKHIAPQKATIVTDVLSYKDGVIQIDGQPLHIITLPGHTPGSIGIITSDNVLYSGDALFGEETLSKHPILFYTDIASTLLSFKKLASLDIKACVLYHGGIINEMQKLIKKHETRILETKETVLQCLRQSICSIDTLTQKIMRKYNIPDNTVAFTLTQTTLRSYIAYLEHEKAIQVVVQNGLLQFITLSS
jgi:glyoxylase-like metal-dependent hydrolase (beta-lactamase superfamily II)